MKAISSSRMGQYWVPVPTKQLLWMEGFFHFSTWTKWTVDPAIDSLIILVSLVTKAIYIYTSRAHTNTETFFNRFYWRILPILCLYMRFMLALFWHQTSGIINFFHETGKLKAQFIGFKLQPRLSWKLAPLNNGPIYKVTFKQSSVQVLPKNCSPKTSLDMEDGNKIQPEEEKHSTKLYK